MIYNSIKSKYEIARDNYNKWLNISYLESECEKNGKSILQAKDLVSYFEGKMEAYSEAMIIIRKGASDE